MESVATKLKALRAAAHPKMTVRDMAEALGVPASTYSFYEGPLFKKPILPFALAQRIAAVLKDRGIAEDQVMALAGLKPNSGLAPVGREHVLKVKAAVAAGVWLEHVEWPESEWYDMKVGPPPLPGAERFALRMVGRSMDQVIPPGSDLECLRVAFGEVEPVPGDIVVIERHQHGLVEMTCKRLERDGEEWIALPQSSAPEFQEPIRLGKPDQRLYADDEVRITGIVLNAQQNHWRRR